MIGRLSRFLSGGKTPYFQVLWLLVSGTISPLAEGVLLFFLCCAMSSSLPLFQPAIPALLVAAMRFSGSAFFGMLGVVGVQAAKS